MTKKITLNRYKVIVFINNLKKLVWMGDCKIQAYDQFLNARIHNIKKYDVVLYNNNNEIEIYNAQEDADHDQITLS